ncbi:putative aspartic-type endopeptidase opsB [Cladobotryum mycophilum]|uniref:Aspartic-type endopeptidase opsB n=1 Tax=Cladobotryum mycophilum TaxID=491253 RepID=A0ABR0SLG4_9HYPO
MKARSLAAAGVVLASTAHSQVVQFDIEKRQLPNPNLNRRATNAFDTPILNNQQQGGYFVNVQVGSPGQQLTLQLDTGSSDVWVPYTGASICAQKTSQNPGCTLGSFDPDKSDTFEDLGKGSFSIKYVDNSYSKGDYFQDVFQIGGATVKNLTMGLGLSTTIPNGLIGVGYTTNEASIATTGDTYPNLPVAMQQNGLIKTVAYSLWLNDLDASKGSILFGGIDTEKYVGGLTKLNLVSESSRKTVSEFAVQMYSLEAISPSGSDLFTSEEDTLVAVLDSGTTLTYLPQDWAEQAWQEVGAVYDARSQLPLLPCSFANSRGHFSFGFGGPNGPRINVTMDELVLDVTNGQQPKFDIGPFKGQTICEFGILNQSAPPYLLGDTFLRSAYVVYDLVNNQVGIAATDFNATKSNIVPFPSNGAPIPSATEPSGPTDTALPTAAKKTNLAAASGFQEVIKGSGNKGNGSNNDNAAGSLTVFSCSGMAVVGMTMLYALMGGAFYGLRLV